MLTAKRSLTILMIIQATLLYPYAFNPDFWINHTYWKGPVPLYNVYVNNGISALLPDNLIQTLA